MDQEEDPATARWRRLRDRCNADDFAPFKQLVPLIDELMMHPRLSRLYPFTSVYILCLSRCTQYPFVTDGCPRVHAIGEGIFRVFRPGGSPIAYRANRHKRNPKKGLLDRMIWWRSEGGMIGEVNAKRACALMGGVLSRKIGPAVDGDEEDFRRFHGLPLLDTQTEEFFRAVVWEDIAKVEHLLDQGVDINAVDYEGMTALIRAVYSGNVAAVPLLLRRGAKVNEVTNDGQTALSIAIEDNLPEIAALLRSTGARDRARYGLSIASVRRIQK